MTQMDVRKYIAAQTVRTAEMFARFNGWRPADCHLITRYCDIAGQKADRVYIIGQPDYDIIERLEMDNCVYGTKLVRLNDPLTKVKS